jgi:hypothetical protein
MTCFRAFPDPFQREASISMKNGEFLIILYNFDGCRLSRFYEKFWVDSEKIILKLWSRQGPHTGLFKMAPRSTTQRF